MPSLFRTNFSVNELVDMYAKGDIRLFQKYNVILFGMGKESNPC